MQPKDVVERCFLCNHAPAPVVWAVNPQTLQPEMYLCESCVEHIRIRFTPKEA
jgi:hypothetical protein